MIFSSCFMQQPQATEAVEKRCFSRISDEIVFWRGFGTIRGTVFSPRQVIAVLLHVSEAVYLVFRRRFVASSSFTFEAGGVFWRLGRWNLNLFLYL